MLVKKIKSLFLTMSMATIPMIPLTTKADLIVLASPQSNDAYYAKVIPRSPGTTRGPSTYVVLTISL